MEKEKYENALKPSPVSTSLPSDKIMQIEDFDQYPSVEDYHQRNSSTVSAVSSSSSSSSSNMMSSGASSFLKVVGSVGDGICSMMGYSSGSKKNIESDTDNRNAVVHSDRQRHSEENGSKPGRNMLMLDQRSRDDSDTERDVNNVASESRSNTANNRSKSSLIKNDSDEVITLDSEDECVSREISDANDLSCASNTTTLRDVMHEEETQLAEYDIGEDVIEYPGEANVHSDSVCVNGAVVINDISEEEVSTGVTLLSNSKGSVLDLNDVRIQSALCSERRVSDKRDSGYYHPNRYQRENGMEKEKGTGKENDGTESDDDIEIIEDFIVHDSHEIGRASCRERVLVAV